MTSSATLHAGPVATAGTTPEAARLTGILLHGRGASASSILELGLHLDPADVAWIAPQADHGTWYPQRFVAPLEANEPWLSAALDRVAELIGDLERRGVPSERIVVAGFSQGACLALESTLRLGRRFAAVLAFTGGLIGPPGTSWSPEPRLAGTPILLASGDPDPHVPWSRVAESAAVFEGSGARVELARYPGRGHTVSRDELDRAGAILAGALRSSGEADPAVPS